MLTSKASCSRIAVAVVALLVALIGVAGSASAAPTIDVSPGTGVAGYLPLALFGIAPTPFTDDQNIDVAVPAFSYAGETWTTIGVDSNGFVIVGGSGSSSVGNQNFPAAAAPNNVLAPFWTDLNPGAGGEIRVGTLTDGSDDWIVVDWAAVKNFSNAVTNSFEIWIGVDGDTNPGEDITFTYGAVGSGDGGFLTVGAEDKTGTVGDVYYFNGAGTLPTNGTTLRVTTRDLPVAVPEPLTIVLLALGATGLAGQRRLLTK